MKIKRLKLQNFRNYQELDIKFDEKLNLISGQNAQGKTNLIEAIYILSTLKSFRNSKLVDCIRDGETQAIINADIFSDKYGKQKIKFVINKEQENEYYINHNKLIGKNEILGNVFATIFSPDELRIVKQSPDARREFLDTDISQVSKVYRELIDRYEIILSSRNKVLKNNKFDRDIDLMLSVWDEQLAVVAGQIAIARENFVKKLNKYTKKIVQAISGGKEDFWIEYIGPQGSTRIEKTEKLLKELKKSRARDIEVGYTSSGTHRDDLKFYINTAEVKPFASQGQQRSVVLALKLAELEVFAKEKEYPILLLDDVFSELDTTRQRLLYEYIKDRQVLITGTNIRVKPKYDFLDIKVRNGTTRSKAIKKKHIVN